MRVRGSMRRALLFHRLQAKVGQLILEIRPKMSFQSEGSEQQAAVQGRSVKRELCSCFLAWAFQGSHNQQSTH